MSVLPSGSYTSHSMATSGKTLVSPDGGAWCGYYVRARVLEPASAALLSATTGLLPGSSALPSGTLSAQGMSVSGKTLIAGGTSGVYVRRRWIVLPGVAAAFSCTGNVAASFALSVLPFFGVVGQITLALLPVTGTVGVSGSFSCVGEVQAHFSPVGTNGFSVQGEVLARFLLGGGQLETCISGPDTPVAGRPANAVY